ncbi:DUF4440 domain-containing protein [Euryhalocaulis caribicus]|uniref:DUF4440 domain-containing protein n=1 Tax=Euryhalocaulis caribicus TaxID=1161401 RepID=UPI0003A24E8D|nr:DUF4440 domain-containing protein [Euryhalocaulis caribicus]
MYDIIGPHWHPIVVHFTIGLLAVAAFLYAVALARKQTASARIVADWTFAFGLLALIVTVGFGFMAYYTVAHDGPSHAAMTDHRNWALVTAAVFLGLGLWRWLSKGAGALFTAGMILAAVLLGVTGFKGGHLVFQYGLGVQSMPEAEGGAGHDHDHGDGAGHGEEEAAAGAEDGGHPHEESGEHAHDAAGAGSEPVEAALPGSPEAAAAALHQALVAGDEAAVRNLLAENVLILEGGGAEQSLEEYASGHMVSDMAFLGAIETETLSRRSRVQDDSAWVATETRMEGEFRDSEIAIKSQETLVMARQDGGWRITHIHWSNAPLDSGHAAEKTLTADDTASDDHSDHEH